MTKGNNLTAVPNIEQGTAAQNPSDVLAQIAALRAQIASLAKDLPKAQALDAQKAEDIRFRAFDIRECEHCKQHAEENDAVITEWTDFLETSDPLTYPAEKNPDGTRKLRKIKFGKEEAEKFAARRENRQKAAAKQAK